MNIRSLTLKNILKDENKEEYFDLSVPSFDVTSIQITDVHLVNQDEEGRIDKICKSYYGNSDFIDVLCFVNHIYNPFSVKEGDLLLIPEITSYAGKIYKKPEIPTWLAPEETKQNSNNKKKTNEKDENRINRLKQQKKQRKPNELPEGATIKKYVNGKIILGTHLNTNNG